MKPLVTVLNRQRTEKVPFWFMRQAGRYLPEYCEIREKGNGFSEMIRNPETAAEITMQPVRRFGMDGAIIFSDILVVPEAMGLEVRFEEGTGPKLKALESTADAERLIPEQVTEKLPYVYEAVSLVRDKLQQEGYEARALIGFSGAPWTLACYMIEGGSSRDYLKTRLWAYRDPDSFENLIRILETAIVLHLEEQVRAGCEVIQLFDSWAGILDASQFQKWVLTPSRRIVQKLKERCPGIPAIGFPKGAGQMYLKYAQETGLSAVSLDSGVSPQWAAKFLLPEIAVQGNLDPVCLLAGGDALELEAERVLGNLSSGDFIFNLGHGIHKDTPIAHVARLCDIIKGWHK